MFDKNDTKHILNIDCDLRVGVSNDLVNILRAKGEGGGGERTPFSPPQKDIFLIRIKNFFICRPWKLHALYITTDYFFFMPHQSW